MALADGGVSFHDLVPLTSSGIEYERTPSLPHAVVQQLREQETITFLELFDHPQKWRGAPGVALFDYDSDGDLDIYVTNGPGTDNSLYSNQLLETGELRFIDVAVEAGVQAHSQDSSGVCFGDTDNDGDPDLFVLSNFTHNRFFRNNGNGTFQDLSPISTLSRDTRYSVACSFGDVDNDGLLDVAVANAFDMSNSLAIAADPFAFNQHNELYLNLGNNEFQDVSESSGIRDLRGFPDEFEGFPSLTWAIALVDYDLDGDVDILHADDQGVTPTAASGGVDRGFNHVLENDGTGHFSDVTVEAGMDVVGSWMGLSFGDLNGDGHLDVFSTNFGDWANTTTTPLDPVFGDFGFYNLGDLSSRWFLGTGDGRFKNPGLGSVVATPFGWGTSMADYDNDGDTDIIYHGGLASPISVQADNLGVILQNNGRADFKFDDLALADSTEHQRRIVHGMAIGDIDDDGYTDIVSVSSLDIQESIPLTLFQTSWGSPFDHRLNFQINALPVGSEFGVWKFVDIEDNVNGTLSIEINSGGNRRWAKVRLMGTVGLTPNGMVNRDGIGAVVRVWTNQGARTMRPVLGGSSYASQDELELVFGMGEARRAMVEILWPGGTRNRFYGIRRGERVLIPEIPCSFTADWGGIFDYTLCLVGSLYELHGRGIIGEQQLNRLFVSGLRAFQDHRF